VEPSAAGLRRLGVLLGSVLSLAEPALAPDDSREALPAEAPVASELGLERGDTPVRLGMPFASLDPDEGYAWLGVGAVWLELPPAAPGAACAKAAVAPAADRAATAQSVVIVRI
jgi:hypothetical protein